MSRTGRNDPCPCGSGNKYKHCCMIREAANKPDTLSREALLVLRLEAALNHFHGGQLVEAAEGCRQVLQVLPNQADALNLLGLILRQQGNRELAIETLSQAVNARPSDPAHYSNLGVALMEAGHPDDAILCFSQAIQLKPDNSMAYSNLGNAFKDKGALNEAVDSYRKAIEIDPNYADAHNNLGYVLEQMGRLNEAVAAYLKAIGVKPDFAEAFHNLGNALSATGQLDEAAIFYRQAITLRPNLAEAHNNLGKILKDQGQLEEAVARYRQALAIRPDYAEAHSNLGNAFKDKGELDAATEQYRQALSIKPDLASAFSNLLMTLQYLSDISPTQIFEEHRHFAERYEIPLKATWNSHANLPDPDRPLKIGYVSGDFRNHAVAYFIEPILASHNRADFEVFGYYSHTRHDSHTDTIAKHMDHWLPCAGIEDGQLAERIRADGIDILVDLAGHTAHNRLPVFARKPAPVQATWIGYPGSTGLAAMDYRITDKYMDPPGLTERYHSETLIRLPDSEAAYRPEPLCPPVNPLPALGSGNLTLASLNNLTKINAPVVALWARILAALPTARLMLGNVTEPAIGERILAQFARAGVAAERLILQPRVGMAEYLEMHHQIDLALDPFPYNGGTTTSHSLWMGVPVLTLAGGHTIARCGVSLLSRVGLTEFIADSEDAYFHRALAVARDLPALDRVRQSLRGRMMGANCDPKKITADLETAFRQMWRHWCATRNTHSKPAHAEE